MDIHNTQSPPPQADPAMQFSPHTVLIALRCWWKVVLPVAIVLSAVTGAALYFTHQHKYTAEAWLLIQEKLSILNEKASADLHRFVANQQEIMRSPRLLGPLVSQPAIATTPELAIAQDPTLTLATQLKLRPRGQSDIYVLSFSSASPDKAELIVREVTEAYLTFSRKMASEQDNRIVRLLEDQRAARFEEMNQLRENVRALSIERTGVDPFNAASDDEEQKANSAVGQLQGDIINAEVEIDILTAQLKSEEERLSADNYEVTETEVQGFLDQHPRLQAQKLLVEDLQKRIADYEKTGKNLATNPAYKQLQLDLETETKEIETLRTTLHDEVKEGLSKNHKSVGAEKLRLLKEEIGAKSARLKVLRDRFEGQIKSAKQYAGTSLELEFRRAKLDQVTDVHDRISAKILTITTEQRAPERVELFKEVTRPVRPDDNNPLRKVGLGAAVAFVVPFLLAIGWEHLFRRVSNRMQVEATNQLTVVAEVTSLPRKRRRSAIGGKRAERDVLLFEESIDSLRTYLSFVESVRGLRVLAVASAVSGEGKTSLASQLAVSVARATGELTLLIDGDMRSPDVHAIFDVPLSPGLSEVLKQECSLEDAIDTSFSEKLHVVPAGRLSASPHRLLSRGEFPVLLKKLLETYRHIIIDTPPILPASEALVMARSADASLLCMRRDYSRIDQVREAYSRMNAAGVKVAGAVLNGIPMQHYAYKYGSYVYGEVPATSEV